MAAHITYLSEEALHRKFGRNLQNRDKVTFGFDADFQVESYLRHQGISFVDRFDANSYLYITRAMDYFDLAADYGGVLASAFDGTKTRFCVVSFTSDWLYPDARKPRHRAGAERGGGQCQLRRNRKRQGPRRVPAGRAGTVQCDPRVPERGSAAAGPGRTRSRRQPMSTFKERAKAELANSLRIDLPVIAEMVEPGARVLDVGCGEGAAPEAARRTKAGRRARHRAEAVPRERLRGAAGFR